MAKIKHSAVAKLKSNPPKLDDGFVVCPQHQMRVAAKAAMAQTPSMAGDQEGE
tara:strand:+ start:181 stop:339 length:159 start_codon:yes stop_codon:yes gene_type:complete